MPGTNNKGKIDVTNSYAVPFDEDPKEPGVWFVDHMYHEKMLNMSGKVRNNYFDFLDKLF